MEVNLDKQKIKELVISQINRKIVFLTKLQLELFDEIRNMENCNISENTLNYWRKRLLDRAGDTNRDIERFLEKLDFDLK